MSIVLLESIAILLFKRMLYINFAFALLLCLVFVFRKLPTRNIYLLNLIWLLPLSAIFCYNLTALYFFVRDPIMGSLILYTNWFVVVFLIGIFVAAVIHRIKGRKLRRVMRMSSPCSDAEEILHSAKDALGIHKTVKLRQISFHAPPFVYGFIRPAIYLPHDWRERYDDQALNMILMHELVHVKQGDLPVRAICNLFSCLFWYNPLLYIALPLLYIDRELLCDAKVLSHQAIEKASYGKLILLEAMDSEILMKASVGFAAKSHIIRRVSAIAHHTATSKRTLHIMTAIGFAVLTVLSVSYLSFSDPILRDEPMLTIFEERFKGEPLYVQLTGEDKGFRYDDGILYVERDMLLAHLSTASTRDTGSFVMQYHYFDKLDYGFADIACRITYDGLLNQAEDFIILHSEIDTPFEKLLFFIFKYV